MAGIRIDALPTTVLPTSGHVFPAMKDGLSVKLTLAQVAEVMLFLGLIDDDTAQTLINKTLINPTLINPTLTLKQSATPAPTASGDIQYGTTNKVLEVGDGVANRTFVPIPAATVAGDIEYFTGAKAKARLAKGTAGQIMAMNSGATAPEWQNDQRIGVGQTWQSMSGSRTVGTSYQNTTGRVIGVSVTAIASGGGAQPALQASADNVSWVSLDRGQDAVDYLHGKADIPAGHYYRVQGSSTIAIWSELR